MSSAATTIPPDAPSTIGTPASAASTSPGSIAWESDSAAYVWRRCRIQTPSGPHTTPSSTTSASARRSSSLSSSSISRGRGGSGRRRSPRRGSRAPRRTSRAAPARSARPRAAPKAICVPLRHSTLSHRRAWSMSCVDTSRPLPSERSSSRMASRPASLARSTPVNGSSSSSSGASCSSARAMSTRWRWPPESAPNRVPACAARPTRSSMAVARSRSPRPSRRHAGVRA